MLMDVKTIQEGGAALWQITYRPCLKKSPGSVDNISKQDCEKLELVAVLLLRLSPTA